MSTNKTNILCDVATCKYNSDKFCKLDEVKISCNCGCEECNCIDDTICESFEEKEEDY